MRIDTGVIWSEVVATWAPIQRSLLLPATAFRDLPFGMDELTGLGFSWFGLEADLQGALRSELDENVKRFEYLHAAFSVPLSEPREGLFWKCILDVLSNAVLLMRAEIVLK